VVRPLALVFAFAAACSGNATGSLTLSWRFADGRRCTEAGVSTVSAFSGEERLMSGPCADGDAPRAIQIENAPRGGTLLLRGFSPQNAELYRAEQQLDPTLLLTTLTLYTTLSR
jgi:hypothetical protein